MAKNLSKSGITTSATAEAWHVTQSVDALTGVDAYNITISGSLNLTGSAVTGSFSGDGTNLTGVISSSYAVTASHALNAADSNFTAAGISGSWQNQTSSMSVLSSSYAVTASYAENGGGGSSLWYDGTTYLSSSVAIIVDSHIIASGNISASGDVYGDNLIVATDITASGDISASAGIVLGGVRKTSWPAGGAGLWYDGGTYISSSESILVNRYCWVESSSYVGGALTASSDISASGDVYGDKGIFGGNLTCATSPPGNPDGVKISGSSTDGDARNNQILYNRYLQIRNVSSGNEGIILTHDEIISGSAASTASFGTYIGDGSQLTGVTSEWDGTLNGDAEITGSLILSGSNIDLNVLGNITASSNISANGYFTGSSAYFDNRVNTPLLRNPSSILINSDSGDITLSGNKVIASSDISASGNITAYDISASHAFHVESDTHTEFTTQGSHFNMINQTADKHMFFLTTAGTGTIRFGTDGNNSEVIIGTGGNITASGNFDIGGELIQTGFVSTSASAPNIAGISVWKITLSGASVLTTLGNGTPGQRLTIYCDDDSLTGGDDVQPLTTPSNYTSISFTEEGDSADLIYDGNIGWVIIGSYGAVIT